MPLDVGLAGRRWSRLGDTDAKAARLDVPMHNPRQLRRRPSGVRDESSDRASPFGRIICFPARGASPEQLRDMLLDVPGVCTTMRVALPRPLPALITDWSQANASADLLASLAALEHALPSQH